MTKAEQIAKMFGDDGQSFLCRGEYLSETRTLTEICDLQCVRKERGRESYDEDGDLTRYEFHDGSAIVVAESCWDIEGDEKFSFSSYTTQ